MLYFPQLMTGAASQFPCTKRAVQRTVVNEDAGGGKVKLFDPGGCRVEWELELRGLAIQEWTAIDDLFDNVEGRLGTFSFLDPFGNLLKWSEDLRAAAWKKDAGIQLDDGVADPFGGSRATKVTNTGGAQQRLSQTAALPGWFQYCISAYARSDVPATITLFAAAGAATASQDFPALAGWRRVEFPVLAGTQDEAVTFGVAVESGAPVEVFGLQVDAQPGASKYKRTTTHSGLFASAYFVDDELQMKSNAQGEFSCTVRIGASGS
jgi:hypothetical protein